MSNRQQYALAHPLVPDGLVDRRLWRTSPEFGVVSALAVVRSRVTFDGRPAWHAACGLLGPFGDCIPLAEFTGSDRRSVRRFAERLVEGVGIPGWDIWEETESLLHVRRPLSDLDMADVPVAWQRLEPSARC